jgi:hypothetical protein
MGGRGNCPPAEKYKFRGSDDTNLLKEKVTEKALDFINQSAFYLRKA